MTDYLLNRKLGKIGYLIYNPDANVYTISHTKRIFKDTSALFKLNYSMAVIGEGLLCID